VIETVKEFLKSVNIWEIDRQKLGGTFFMVQCVYIYSCNQNYFTFWRNLNPLLECIPRHRRRLVISTFVLLLGSYQWWNYRTVGYILRHMVGPTARLRPRHTFGRSLIHVQEI